MSFRTVTNNKKKKTQLLVKKYLRVYYMCSSSCQYYHVSNTLRIIMKEIAKFNIGRRKKISTKVTPEIRIIK